MRVQQTWQGAYPIEAVGRTYDDRAESGVQPDLWIFRRPWLGIRRLRDHQARRHRGGARPVWLGWWLGTSLYSDPREQVVGKRWDEVRLPAMAKVISEVTGPFQRPPGY
jgi:hypothetical protein